MAPGDATFRARAASLFHPFTSSKTPDHDLEKSTQVNAVLSEKHHPAEGLLRDSHGHHTSGDNAVAYDKAAHRIVRSIPGQSSDLSRVFLFQAFMKRLADR